MNAERYEIEPRPEALGGGWNLHVFGRNPETGESIEIGGGIFPVEPGQDSQCAYTDALQTAQDWLAVDGEAFSTKVKEQEMSDDNILVPEVVGKTITQMRIYAEEPGGYEVGLWFTDGTEITVEIESRTQINLKHVGPPEQEPNNITAQMNVLNARLGD